MRFLLLGYILYVACKYLGSSCVKHQRGEYTITLSRAPAPPPDQAPSVLLKIQKEDRTNILITYTETDTINLPSPVTPPSHFQRGSPGSLGLCCLSHKLCPLGVLLSLPLRPRCEPHLLQPDFEFERGAHGAYEGVEIARLVEGREEGCDDGVVGENVDGSEGGDWWEKFVALGQLGEGS